ncbi:MAG: transketolase [Candidatus Sumerlaeota bacterium]|nr:transketolase [Candidatus Sumerlaeota bacterium]
MTVRESQPSVETLQILANRLRRHSMRSTTQAGSGHPTSCMSAAEIVAAIFFKYLRFDIKDPKDPRNDRFVLSKGHAAPVLWAAWAEAGAFPVEKLMTLREFSSDLEGHPTPRNPLVDVGTGSLGQGLSVGIGMALRSRMDRIDNRVYVLMGDGEVAEGSVWEAAALAGHCQIDNLAAIVDVNRLGQSQPTMLQHDVETHDRRFQSFGWHTRVIDGHDLEQVIDALDSAQMTKGRPTAIIARTLKGKGVSFIENKNGYHGKPLTKDELARALEELGPDQELKEKVSIRMPEDGPSAPAPAPAAMKGPQYKETDQVATRQAYGAALRKLGEADPRIVALDGDVKNSTYSEEFAKAFPDRFVECFIAEQNMVGAAMGLAALGKIPFASTFACFLSRAYDQIRMAGISRSNLKLCGSHAGISIGEDGPSQMALEDIAMMRAIAGSTVLYPSDAVCAERMVELAARTPGIVFIRTSRPKTPILYPNDETFEIGGSKTLRSSRDDRAAIVGAGVTLHEALKAYEILRKEGVRVRVIDLYSVKPLDATALRRAARDTELVITVEDHYPEGGLGEAVLAELAGESCKFKRLAVNGVPRSGKPDELMEHFGISARVIVDTVKSLL